jgi:hypothetical protein
MMFDEFRSKLEAQLTGPCLRPFVFDGSPLRCRIFIVGTNSARLVEKPFSSFWDASYGFKKKEFIRELEQKPPGLTRTRKAIEIVAKAAGQNVTLDTNLYMPSTAREKDLKKEDKKTDVLEFLLREIKPQLVLTNGNKAIKFFRRRCAVFVENRVTPQTVTLNEVKFQLLCSRHLSRISFADANNIGQALANALRTRAQAR